MVERYLAYLYIGGVETRQSVTNLLPKIDRVIKVRDMLETSRLYVSV